MEEKDIKTTEKEMIKIVDENGKEKEVEVLHYFKLNSNNKDYLVYTDNTEDGEGNVLVYTSEVIETGDKIELEGITDEKVLKEITEILTNIINE